MSVPAHAPQSAGDDAVEQAALAALESNPDLARRLRAGDPAALAEYLELVPGVQVDSISRA